jgi:hypothetical protein
LRPCTTSFQPRPSGGHMLFGREPAMVAAFIGAVIALAISFGLDLTEEQVGGIMAVVSLGLGLITRSQVTPVSDQEE